MDQMEAETETDLTVSFLDKNLKSRFEEAQKILS